LAVAYLFEKGAIPVDGEFSQEHTPGRNREFPRTKCRSKLWRFVRGPIQE